MDDVPPRAAQVIVDAAHCLRVALASADVTERMLGILVARSDLDAISHEIAVAMFAF
jgi:hypothetical protein